MTRRVYIDQQGGIHEIMGPAELGGTLGVATPRSVYPQGVGAPDPLIDFRAQDALVSVQPGYTPGSLVTGLTPGPRRRL